ncbi:MAG: hypothetical protein ABIF71_08655 [Planctomycetota bacterium]
MRRLMIVAVLLAAAGSVHAARWHADGSVTASGPGTSWGGAFKTL